jgi:bacteriorhodopsin
MATKIGIGFRHIRIRESHDHGIPPTFRNVYRQVYYARYVDWLLTIPLLLLDLSILAGLNGASILSAVVAQLVVIVAGMFSSFSARKAPRWGW